MPQLDIVTYFSQYVWLSVGVFLFICLTTARIYYMSCQASEIRSLLSPGKGETMSSSSSPLSLSKRVWSIDY